MTTAIERALRRRDASVIGVGQGRQTSEWAAPRQAEIRRAVEQLGTPHVVLHAVDSDGERSAVVIPKLSRGVTTELGARFGQRSVLVGDQEVGTTTNEDLLRFGKARVSTERPEGFSTFIEESGLYYQLVPVSRHLRNGRPVVGYSTRRRARSR
jgi:hypothetical protein